MEDFVKVTIRVTKKEKETIKRVAEKQFRTMTYIVLKAIEIGIKKGKKTGKI